MKKTLLYLLILGLLSFAVYYVLRPAAENPFDAKEAGFNVKDSSTIGKVFIADFENQTILIERTDTGWLLNKQYRALPSMVRLVLGTLHLQQPLYPVTKAVLPNAIKQLSTTGTKIEVYDRKGAALVKFYVGGSAPNATGTIMMVEGASTPYVVHIQSFNGDLETRFSAHLKDWRDRTVFDVPAGAIKSVSVKYFTKPEHSFVLTNEGSEIKVKGKMPEGKKESDLNLHNAHLYLGYFANINCEGYLNGSEGMDSLIRTGKRHSVIDIEDTSGKDHHVEVYWMPLNKRSKNMRTADPDVPDDFDTDRYFALINGNKDTVMIQQYVFKTIFRKMKEFYQGVPPIAPNAAATK